MADSYRLAVLKALTTHLKGITGEEYENDLSDQGGVTRVVRGRVLFGDDAPVPLVSILEAPRPDAGLFTGEGKQHRKETWNLLVQGWTVDDVMNPTDPVYSLMNDVEKRLFRLTLTKASNGEPAYPNEYLLGRTISDLTVLPGVVRPPMAEPSSKAFFYLPIQVGLVRPSE